MEERRPLWLEPFDKPSRLLLHALMSGPSGPQTASQMLQRIQSQQPFDWMSMVGTLCREEPSLEGLEKSLTMKPLLFLLPLQCQRNLLRFVHMTYPLVPRACLSKLVEVLGHESNTDSWIVALKALLQRDLQGESGSVSTNPLTDACMQQLRDLCSEIHREGAGKPETESRLGWYRDSGHKVQHKIAQEGLDDKPQNSRKRKNLEVTPDPALWDLNLGQPAKKSRPEGENLVVDLFEGLEAKCTEDYNTPTNEYSGGTGSCAQQNPQNQTGTAEGSVSQTQIVNPEQLTAEPDKDKELPDSIKLRIPSLKEFLETESEKSDQLGAPELQVLNECDSDQLALLCSLLHVSQMSEQALLQFCTKLRVLSPDLSYRNAAVLSKSLFLNRVLLLTEPASRLLITALTLFCSKYAQATCSALIGPLLLTPEKGLVLVEFLCRIIEECLEQEHLILVFSEILEASWSDDVITVLHSLLGRGVEIPPDQFDHLIRKLSHWAPEFIKSMKFAKLMLTVLTKYQNSILVSHHKPLSIALAINETFLKKSLQAALKRLPTS